MEIILRMEWSAAEAARLYRFHHETWMQAQADLDATPWWRPLRRARLRQRYEFHLRRAALFGECCVVVTERST